MYGISYDEAKNTDILHACLRNKIVEALTELKNIKMIRFDSNNLQVHTTTIGRIASNFYIKHKSMEIYIEKLRPNNSEEELLEIFAASSEFEQLKYREDETEELESIRAYVCSITKFKIEKTDMSTSYGKVVILLYGYLAKINV